MAAPDQLYIEFDAASPEESRTIDFSGESQTKKSNEYNISVFNADGSPDRSSVVGMVSLAAYSPGSDRAEQTDNTVDLSTGCRKFNLFFATVQRAVFSVTGSLPGKTIRVSAIRTRGLVVTARDLNPLIPVNLLQWTPDFAGAGYVVIPEWTTTGSIIEAVIYVSALPNANNYIFDGRVSISQGSGLINYQSNGSSQTEGVINLTPVTVSTGKSFQLSAEYVGDIRIIGTRFSINDRHWNGQIRNLRLTDLTTPSNSRFYPMVIESETQPTTLNLIDQFNPNPSPAPVLYIPLRDNLDIVVGDGATTFARAGEATFQRDGVLGLVGVDEPRFEDDGVLIEGESENLHTNTSTIFFGARGADRVLVNDPETDFQVLEVTFDLGSDPAPRVWRDTSSLSIDTYTQSYSIKGIEGETIGLADTLQTPAFTDNLFIHTFSGEWEDFTVTDDLSTVRQIFTYFRKDLINTSTSADVFRVRGLQLELLGFKSSWIPTEGVPVTRPNDDLTVPFTLARDSDYTIVLTSSVQFLGRRIFDNDSGATTFQLNTLRSGEVRLGFAGGVYRIIDAGITTDRMYTYCLTRTGLFLDGVRRATFNRIPDLLPVGGLIFGNSSMGNLPTFGNFKNYAVYGRTLTDAEILLVSNSPVPLNLRPPTSGTLTNFPAGMEWTEVITG